MTHTHDTTLQAVQAELARIKRELALVMTIDHIRDTVYEPVAMLAAIVNQMAAEFHTDLCLLSLIERETAEMELKAMHKGNPHLGNLDTLVSRELAAEAMKLRHVAIWHSDDAVLGGSELPQGLEVAAVPIIMGENKPLGAMLLIRLQQPFSDEDIVVLETAEDHIDSAIIQGYQHLELAQRNKELETIYRIDHIRDNKGSFDEMLNTVIHELQDAVDAEMGYVMLYDAKGERLQMRASTHRDLYRVSTYSNIIEQYAREALQTSQLVCHNDLGENIRSVMCLPLILNDKIIGVLGVVNHYSQRGFSGQDRRLLAAIGSQMDTAIFESMEKRHLRQVLGRSVDPNVMERLLASGENDFLKGERRVLSVLYADIRGSTSLAENTEPELLVEFINAYLAAMTESVLRHHGTLDKFVGDEVMALFGAPVPEADHAMLAVRVGLDMQRRHRDVMAYWRGRGVDSAPIGVGIATGELIVGEMGSKYRTDYTVIGRAANLGARICSAAQAGQVLICPTTYEMIQERIEAEPVEGLQFKGVAGRMTVYSVRRVL
ncbi:MAG: GAF domain-containing protein [Chloroflexi bacterium]|nr:GAF domain-containing protein [Chloroflexota bacterium]